ncbi:hypothetical protein P9112_004363 [Eukaryota sp. TZLM1-RC]
MTESSSPSLTSTQAPPAPVVIPPSPPRTSRPKTPPYRTPSPLPRSPDRYSRPYYSHSPEKIDRRRHARHSSSSPPRRRRRYDDRDRSFRRSFSPERDRDRPMSFKQYCRTQPSASASVLQQRYEEYRANFDEHWAREYFTLHKDNPEFRKKYHPIEKEGKLVDDVAAQKIVDQKSTIVKEPAIEEGQPETTKVRCGVVECRKLFKGMQFMEKHFRTKHEELVEVEKKAIEEYVQDDFFNHFYTDPSREKPQSPRDPTPSPPRTPPRRYEPDPRSRKEVLTYRDLDAPRKMDFSGLDYGL